MNNIVQRVITIGLEYRPCSDLEVEVASVDVLALPSNVGAVEFEGDTGSPVPWQPGEWHSFGRVNLALLRVRGVPGDRVTLVGGTW